MGYPPRSLCAGRSTHDITWMSEVVPGVERDLNIAIGPMNFNGTQCIPAPPGHAKHKNSNRRRAHNKTTAKGVSFGEVQKASFCVIGFCEIHVENPPVIAATGQSEAEAKRRART